MAMAFSSVDRQGLLVVWDPVGPGLAVLGMLLAFLSFLLLFQGVSSCFSLWWRPQRSSSNDENRALLVHALPSRMALNSVGWMGEELWGAASTLLTLPADVDVTRLWHCLLGQQS